MTIRIDTTAASSIAVIPLMRDRRLRLLLFRDCGDLLFTVSPPKRDLPTYTKLKVLREVNVKSGRLRVLPISSVRLLSITYFWILSIRQFAPLK